MSPQPTARQRAQEAAARRWRTPGSVTARAPGRVNLIGDHTDYNEGVVLPFAIDRDTCVAARPRDDGLVVIETETEHEAARFPATELGPKPADWAVYPWGVLGALAARGVAVKGFEAVVASDVPLGAGLSSSASFEVAIALVASRLAGVTLEPTALARVTQEAEEQWVGMPCGIMDQLSVVASACGAALRIDCRSLDHELVPIPGDAAVLVLDTGTRRGLTASAYEQRRAECERAARALGVASLRDLPDEAPLDDLDAVAAARVRHVRSENRRVLEVSEALAAGNLHAAGARMNQSHVSLRDDYEVSTPELDAMVQAALAHGGCYGARLTGAGFGGCAVALVDGAQAEAIGAGAAATYRSVTGHQPTVHRCAPAAGATLVTDAALPAEGG